MSIDEPDVIPSPVDPDCECVKSGAELSTPPSEEARMRRGLCPKGYLPRRRRRAQYQLRGKEVITEHPPVANPEPPPELPGSQE